MIGGGNSDNEGDEDDEDFDSLFEQETVYRYSKMLAHFTLKASVQGPQNTFLLPTGTMA